MAFISQTLDRLPELDADAQQHLQLVLQSLYELTDSRGGMIGFDEYMNHVLYAPGTGYYSAGSSKFGQSGDYITAPLISPLFSQTLARFLAQQFSLPYDILELGAGTGEMAKDILQNLEINNALPERYLILEPSADLQQRQQELLAEKIPQLINRVKWLSRLPEKDSINGIIVGNEVIDALPVKRFTKTSNGWQELGFGFQNNQPEYTLMPFNKAFSESVAQYMPQPHIDYPSDYNSELNTQLTGWLAALEQCLNSGMLLFLDYGYARREYYSPQRISGTLRGYYRHWAIDDPFFAPGLMDITASVDFTALAEAGDENDLIIAAYMTQAQFLISNGILELAAHDLNQADGIKQGEALRQLLDPTEMGETIKAMLMTKQHQPNGDFTRDMRYQL